MPELLKISELAARSGVSRSTIQHYLREGVLPPPAEKPHRNMAYYSSDLVSQIQLIKELQTKRNMPLSRIKVLFEDEGAAQIRAYLHIPIALEGAASKPVSRRELAQTSGLAEQGLDKLEELGFIRSLSKGRSRRYSSNDAAIVHAVASMRHAGLNEENGFAVEQMTFYVDAMRNLILQELSIFARVMGTLPRTKVVALAKSGLEGTNSLLLALRRKLFLDLLGEGASPPPDEPSRARKRRRKS